MAKFQWGSLEAKVVAFVTTGGGLNLVLQIAQFYDPHFKLPPATDMGLITTFLAGLAAYFAPHTPKTEVTNVGAPVIPTPVTAADTVARTVTSEPISATVMAAYPPLVPEGGGDQNSAP